MLSVWFLWSLCFWTGFFFDLVGFFLELFRRKPCRRQTGFARNGSVLAWFGKGSWVSTVSIAEGFRSTWRGGEYGLLNGRYCWVRGFWLAWAGRGSRAGAGFCWVPEWQVLLGEGFLVGRVLGEGFLVGRGSSSWKGFLRHGGGLLYGTMYLGRLLVGMGWARAGFWSAGFAHLDGMLGGSWWAPERPVLLGEGFLVARGSSSWKGFFRHGGGFLNGRFCWVEGFGDHLHGRLSFDMVAGFCGLLECRVCAGA